METTNEKIHQLLEMLDNPDAYTEQEIRDIINHDKDTREIYRLMVEAKRSSRHRQDNESVDVNAAWKRFVENEEFTTEADPLKTRTDPADRDDEVLKKVQESRVSDT